VRGARWIAAFLLAAACGRSGPVADACERALARIDRIHARRGWPGLPGAFRDDALALCRTAPRARQDPAVRCAVEVARDEIAAACIDALVARTLRPSAGSRDPRGLNPLLDPGWGGRAE
jgi:hypothetical protein